MFDNQILKDLPFSFYTETTNRVQLYSAFTITKTNIHN